MAAWRLDNGNFKGHVCLEEENYHVVNSYAKNSMQKISSWRGKISLHPRDESPYRLSYISYQPQPL